MENPSDSMDNAEPEENGQSGAADAVVVGDSASTVLAEVLPGIAVVLGEVPPELKPDLIDFGLVPAVDRTLLANALGSIGNAASIAGNIRTAFSGAQGLYRISAETQALLRAGATLAVKDGANLGTVMGPAGILGQARFYPIGAVSAAQSVAAIGPALAMIGLQLQLNEITGLVKTNIELTNRVLASIRNEQWSELTGLVDAVSRAVGQAQEIDAVPASLWQNVAGSDASLRKQLELYQRNVRGHIKQIDQADVSRRREYLQTNAEAIVFDTFALLSSVRAWTGYQTLRAARARAAGHEDASEARLVDVIARDARTEFDSALAETKSLVAALTRELRIIAELPGRESLTQSLTGKRKDSKAAREASARLLEALQPLADALQPPAAPLEAPDVLCAPESLELEPYLRVLRWFVEEDETLLVLAFPDQLDALDPISAILGGAKEMLAAAMDRTAARTLVAVTDRRIITAKTNTLLEQGEIRQAIPIDQVRYVRAATAQDKGARLAVDLITRDESIRWVFTPDIAGDQVAAFAAVLAEAMAIPEAEREELRRRGSTPALEAQSATAAE